MPGAAVTAFFLDNQEWFTPGGILKLGNVTHFTVIPFNSVTRCATQGLGDVTRERTVAFGDVDFEEPC
jgi:hypothetical protein